jgi:hypothetical protein
LGKSRIRVEVSAGRAPVSTTTGRVRAERNRRASTLREIHMHKICDWIAYFAAGWRSLISRAFDRSR